MQSRMAQRRFRGRQRQQSKTLSQLCLDVLPPGAAGPDLLSTPDFSSLFDDSCIDLNMQYLDPNTNTSLPTSSLHTPSSSSASLGLPSIGDPGFLTPEDLEIIMTPSENYLPGRAGLDPHDPENNLLESGKDRDIDAMMDNNNNHSNGWLSILHLAVQKGHDSIVRVLLERNMDCNDPDSDGLTPLMHATIQGHGAGRGPITLARGLCGQAGPPPALGPSLGGFTPSGNPAYDHAGSVLGALAPH
ncbi:ankyrin repeat domain-containing protein [Aspergillus affinis]|uniref:ankyrin repeat domain-containing protein n=1 Tax=Aspergillus affinis TaxID=1070780 RepID=UPI0022FF40F6|nr:uncharacterized protein KD926_004041 [Aspergillus affinis]KAI9046203.1 hypothetical protein KD926_004041 [Aspergillus affinis]